MQCRMLHDASMNSSSRSVFWVLVCLMVLLMPPDGYAGGQWRSLAGMIGDQDALLVADSDGHILFSENADKPLVPASTLKLLTSLVALHYLGPDYRFVTEFYLDAQHNLKIRGHGDPLLISETIASIAARLKQTLGEEFRDLNDIILDDGFFESPISIPGTTLQPFQPYNAPVGALCANFNTVAFKVARRHPLRLVSDERQTPLLPFARRRIESHWTDSLAHQGRMILPDEHHEQTFYAGHLIRYYLRQAGGRLNGRIRLGSVNPQADRLIFSHVSRFTLKEIVSQLLTYSNNFIANQLLICSGIKAWGPPGTLDKGVRAAIEYVKTQFKAGALDDLMLVEGSGISRCNRVTAEMLHQILIRFDTYCSLMRFKNGEYYKTGTLDGIRTRAGYIETGNKQRFNYVVMMNTSGKSAETIVKKVMDICDAISPSGSSRSISLN